MSQLVQQLEMTGAKGKKSKLAQAVTLAGALMSGSLQAELQVLDADELSAITGQAGLTIDIETKLTIGEFEYVDEGSIYQQDISLGGIDTEFLDNLRARVDISNGRDVLRAGFSDVAFYASAGLLDSNDEDVAWAIDQYDQGNGEFGVQLEDGDLLIHVTSLLPGFDVFQTPDPANFDDNLEAYKNAVDLRLRTGAIGLRASDGSVETDITTNFNIDAFLGYLDILIVNRGNEFSATNDDPDGNGKPKNILLRDSFISTDTRFRVEDLDVDQTNNALNTFIPRSQTQPGLTLRDFRIHNERGQDTLGSFGFASVELKTAAASGILEGLGADGSGYDLNNTVEGQAFYDINVRMDWDLPNISFGDTGQSIGQVFFTDFIISDTSLVVSAHE